MKGDRLPNSNVEERQMPENRSGLVKHADAVERQTVSAGRATEMQVLIGTEDGARNFAMRRFIMGAGGGMPRHVNQVEHEQYVLRGRARIGVGDEVYEVGCGDAVFIPAGVSHSYHVLDPPFEFLCVVPCVSDSIRLVDPEDR